MKIIYSTVLLFLPYLINQSYPQVINYSTKIYIKYGVELVQKSYTINISSSEDRRAGEISIRRSNRSGFKLLNAKIIDKNGKVVRTLKKKDIHEVSIRTRDAFFQDGKIVKFDLHWHEFPYQIAYAYEQKFTEFTTVVDWNPFVYSNMSTVQGSLELNVPIDYKMKIYSSGELTFVEDTLPEGMRRLTWTSLFNKIPENEKFAPPLEEGAPRVLIIPDKFKYEIDGSTATWADFGAWINRLNSSAEDLPQSEIAIIDSLIVDCKSKEDVVRKLYRYLQDNTNYINVSIGYGGLKPYPATYVCQNRYGDCKALSIYMKAMLKHAGIESYYTIINSGENNERIKEQMPGQQFNHAFLCVPVNGDTLWLENTSNTLPYDYVSISNRNRFALLVNGAKSKLVKTPAISVKEVAEIRTYNYFLDKSGAGTMLVQGKLKGVAFERFDYIEQDWDEKDKKDALSEYFRIEDVEINDWKIEKTNRNNHSINLLVKGQITKQIKDIGSLKVIKPFLIEVPDFEKPEDRKQPLRINYPVNELNLIIYDLPFLEAYKCQLPDSLSLESKFGSFTQSASLIGNTIKIHRQLILFAGDYTVEQYPEFFNFIDKIKQAQKKSAIILTHRNTEANE